MLKKFLSFIIFILVVFSSFFIFKALRFKSKQIHYPPAAKIDLHDSLITHLAEAIKIKTISTDNPKEFDSAKFDQFHSFLQATFPQVDSQLTKFTINKYSLLYQWKGKNDLLKPIVLAAHIDVVNVPDAELETWSFPPFEGVVENKVLWGRGAMDNKVSVIGMMEAVDYLLKNGFRPNRSIYFAFGHDKEAGGMNGAKAIVAHMKKNRIYPEFVIDEGYSVTQALVPGVLTDVAMIGIAEKESISLKLSAEMEIGQSSMLSEETATQVISNTIIKLTKESFPARITPPVERFLEHIGPEMRFQDKLIYANKNLFQSVILETFRQSGYTNAIVQTKIKSILQNSVEQEDDKKDHAEAIINLNILPGTTIEDINNHVRETIDDERIEITTLANLDNANKISNITSIGYVTINKTIKEIFPEVITAPNLLFGNTDGRHYQNICDDVFRFIPIRTNPENSNAIHGNNEHIEVYEYLDVIRFYIQFIKNTN